MKNMMIGVDLAKNVFQVHGGPRGIRTRGAHDFLFFGVHIQNKWARSARGEAYTDLISLVYFIRVTETYPEPSGKSNHLACAEAKQAAKGCPLRMGRCKLMNKLNIVTTFVNIVNILKLFDNFCCHGFFGQPTSSIFFRSHPHI